MKLLIASVGLLMALSCKPTISQNADQGIKGKVLWLEGNFMPGPGQDKKGVPVVREIFIFPLLNHTDLKREGHFYQTPAVDPVKTTSSNEQGEFFVTLPEGRYSLFAKEEDGLFANLQDGKGNINPVEVKKDQTTEFTFKIDYKAAY